MASRLSTIGVVVRSIEYKMTAPTNCIDGRTSHAYFAAPLPDLPIPVWLRSGKTMLLLALHRLTNLTKVRWMILTPISLGGIYFEEGTHNLYALAH